MSIIQAQMILTFESVQSGNGAIVTVKSILKTIILKTVIMYYLQGTV